jgi:hypothetical protein
MSRGGGEPLSRINEEMGESQLNGFSAVENRENNSRVAIDRNDDPPSRHVRF